MVKAIKIGNTEYVPVRTNTSTTRKRRYSPKRDSSFFFKSPAQKAYESRKNLEHIQNKRKIGLHREEYRKEQAERSRLAKIRRQEQRERFKQKAKALYNKNINNPFKKKKVQHPYGGFDSAKPQ